MGKYLPIIVTADCGSLTRAGKVLGYAQPNMGSIVTRFENELGVKLFHRSQHGVTLTETGEKLVEIMRRIDDMEDYLQEVVTRTRKERFRVGVFQSVATQWMPQVMEEFFRTYPDTVFQLEYLSRELDDETGVRENALDCAFFRGTNFPQGMQHVPLLTEPFYLLVPAGSPLAAAPSLSLMAVAGNYPYIHNSETFDWEEPDKDIRQKLMERDIIFPHPAPAAGGGMGAGPGHPPALTGFFMGRHRKGAGRTLPVLPAPSLDHGGLLRHAVPLPFAAGTCRPRPS